jgi:hypothetical protein
VLGVEDFSQAVGAAMHDVGPLPWPEGDWDERVWQATCVRLPALATEVEARPPTDACVSCGQALVAVERADDGSFRVLLWEDAHASRKWVDVMHVDGTRDCSRNHKATTATSPRWKAVR